MSIRTTSPTNSTAFHGSDHSDDLQSPQPSGRSSCAETITRESMFRRVFSLCAPRCSEVLENLTTSSL
ncbi:hypothetical protein A0H81_01476 [Grifola frondosa]|uniref:Uncharacterized protein n=1 Tax=Grifola frondosa TaxID=5627 RepID=A0A1C7MP95_GRIFR|nr:hypothetical protein A0H81_01476 [Grifola frondosa]